MKRPPRPPREIFLSHASRDRRFATKLARTIRAAGIRVWFSRTHIHGAQQWHDEIGKALRRCDWFVVILSPDAVKSAWVKHELFYALNNKRYENRIVPLLKSKCRHEKLSWTLQEFQFVDFTRGFEEGYRNLMRTWKISGRRS